MLLTLLTLVLVQMLLFLRGRNVKSRQARQARRLMTIGTALLALHFALQLTMGLRLMGVTQSVMLNLAMLSVAALTDGQPLLSDTPELRMAEKAGAVPYMLMQGYYTEN